MKEFNEILDAMRMAVEKKGSALDAVREKVKNMDMDQRLTMSAWLYDLLGIVEAIRRENGELQ
jgi:hypothetical protein